MIINADSLLPHLKEKVRPLQSDTSRHLLCPYCGIRTRLNTLGDGRRKCSVCGKKFRIHKVTDENKFRQCAEILLCFCLDFSSLRASQISHHRFRLVSAYYDHFRRLLAEKSTARERLQLLDVRDPEVHTLQDKSRCRWCQSKLRSGGGEVSAFGVRLGADGEVTIDPLKDDEAGRREGYAGMICCGKFHRFTEEEKAKDGTAQLWTWIRERAQSHSTIWKKSTGYYLKELEWKYNNRTLEPEAQALRIIDLMPADFLISWLLKPEESDGVQSSAEAV